MQPCLGAIYGWGVFVPALKASRSELTVTLSPELLTSTPSSTPRWWASTASSSAQLAEAHASERDTAKEVLDAFLVGVPERLPVSDEVWAQPLLRLQWQAGARRSSRPA